jgi:S-adenosylmethionine:tRNA ribosyltransferase-isomerase
MKISDFKYEYPLSQVALEPHREPRLLAYSRRTQKCAHLKFNEIDQLLTSDYCLVVNNSKVIPGRFIAVSAEGEKIEGLYLKKTEKGVLVWMKKALNRGESISILNYGSAHVVSRYGYRMELNIEAPKFEAYLWDEGQPPLPDNLRQHRKKLGKDEVSPQDIQNVQSIFDKGKEHYSTIPSTPNLHFNANILQNLKKNGVEILELSLQADADVYTPVQSDSIHEHFIHPERVSINPDVWQKIIAAKKARKKVVAVGTTVVRALESAIRRAKEGEPTDSFEADLYIKPPFEFQIVDGLITNFHWPDSALIILVACFMEANKGKCPEQLEHRWKKVYEEAIAKGYRLFTFGDACLIG